MKFTRAAGCLAMGIATALIAACGGGGGGGGGVTATAPPPDPSLQLSGTAATGAALANATVEAKCATGTGSASTGANGAYTLTLQGGKLPCIVRVRSNAVTLHTVVEAGSTNATTAVTSASANLTPVSELLVAQLTANMPAVTYSSSVTDFTGLLTPERVSAAVAAMAVALKANGIDLGGIDPLKGALEGANGTAKGNAYDQLLDQLAAKISVTALPQVVNQVALAAAANSASGLASAIEAISGGSLPGCPTALSGSYRTLEYWGKVVTRRIDFKAMKFQAANGVDWFDIVVDTSQPCAFTAAGMSEGKAAETSVAMGANGAGVYRTRFTNPNTPGAIGYIFPAQSHALGTLAGTWTFLQSGWLPNTGSNHFPGQFTVDTATRKVARCDYDPAQSWACVAAPDAGRNVSARTDGGFDLNEAGASGAAVFYGYRAPSGTLTLFGSTNTAGDNGNPNVVQTHIVAAKLNALVLPASAGGTQAYSEVTYIQRNGVNSTTPLAADASTVLAVDAATATLRRKRASDGLEDTLAFNQPLAGLRTRPALTSNGITFDLAYQVPLPGLGLLVWVNGTPVASTGKLFYAVAVLH